MTKEEKIKNFDPNGVGVNNGHFIGLPFEEEDAEVILLPVPWDVTVSYKEGTALGPINILNASSQLDLIDPFVENAWKLGIFMPQPDQDWMKKNEQLRALSVAYIEYLENGGIVSMNERWKNELHKLNEACESLKKYVYETSKSYHQKGKLIGLVGGEHSVPLGYLEAIAEKYADFGILQIDAHMDLRKAYEGFTYSHASICYNASKIKSISKIIQVGIRDYCQEEMDFVKNSNHRIEVFYDYEISNLLFNGTTFHEICKTIVQKLPENVYISFDIDGLDPSLCPNTGTPVPGGLNFNQALYLIKHVVDSGKKIIGFDLCEVNGNNEWDGNVGARLLYRLSNLMGKSNKKI